MSPSFYDELQAMVGLEAPAVGGRYPASKSMIEHWCEAMEDKNPLYTDEDYARESRYKGVIAPHMMIQSWTFGNAIDQEYKFRHPEIPRPEDAADPGKKVLQKLNDAGYVGTVATGTGYEFLLPVRPGDTIKVKTKVSSISQEKKTGRGDGHFVTTVRIYTNQKGETICNQNFTVLKFKPPQK